MINIFKKTRQQSKRFSGGQPFLQVRNKVVNYPNNHRIAEEKKITKFIHSLLF